MYLKTAKRWSLVLVMAIFPAVLDDWKFIAINVVVKRGVRGPKPYNQIEGINFEKSSLPMILRPSSLNWLLFNHIWIMFQCRICFKKHTRLRTACFDCLCANDNITIQFYVSCQPIVHCDAWQKCCWLVNHCVSHSSTIKVMNFCHANINN